jgi:fructose-1,6-bisphosphatase II
MDRNLALEFVRVTEAAAIAAAGWIGRGDKHAADGAAVDEMRSRFNQIDFAGRVVIGEGEKDEAPELYTGERVGRGKGPVMDLAVDPLEATDSVALGRQNAISVVASGERGSLLHAPDTYMDKIAAGPKAAKVISLGASPRKNVERTAKALKKSVRDVTVLMLERDRHAGLMKEVRSAGARIRTITDGDVAGAIAPCLPDSGIDLLMGVGSSTESVLAAVAVQILGGELLSRFHPLKDRDRAVLKKFEIGNLGKVYRARDLAKGKFLTFTATGVIDGPLLRGVQFEGEKITTHSLVIRGKSGTIRYITTHHHATSQKRITR